MPTAAVSRLSELEGVTVIRNAPLAEYTRFGIGGAADLLIDAATESAFAHALDALAASGLPWIVFGGGTNLVVSDEGFRGAVLRYTGKTIRHSDTIVYAEAGAVLQDLVDYTIALGLSGIHTMTGIPGWVGGAVYGNAGAYGRSIHESVIKVRFFDGARIREFNNAECRFQYRESIFKRNKRWIVFSTELQLTPGDADALKTQAAGILEIRNAKYPPTMKCAGSIFKNLILSELSPAVRAQVPAGVIREGKVPSAYFLEVVGAKGIRNGGIRVADYHANLIYNAGGGTAREVREVIADLKQRVTSHFGLELEEEVQYVGF